MDTEIADALARAGKARTPPAAQEAAGLSAAQRVCEELRRRIINLDLPPNTVLSRAGLAREFGVSQTPVREALQKLEAEGLVDIFPQSRTIVTRLVVAEIHEAHFLRIAVETEVVRRLAASCDPAVVKRLRTLLTMQEALAGDPDELVTFQELDETFHGVLFAAVGQPRLHTLLRSRTGHLNRLRRLDLPGPEKIDHILTGHRAIIDALAAADPEAAQAAIRHHLSQTVSRVETLRGEHPDYFA